MDLLKTLPRSFYDRSTLDVARDLIGKRLCCHLHDNFLSARIVETEAYIGREDEACHAATGRTNRNQVMFGPPGYTYVYFIYGMYHCLNVVTEREGFPAAVLIRAAEPREGFGLTNEAGMISRALSGPGKLCREFGLTLEHNGLSLTGSKLFVADANEIPRAVSRSARVGLSKGNDKQWRFFDADSQTVSKGPSYERDLPK